MSTERYEQNFGTCALGDQRLSRRALSIGQALSEKFGAGLSSVFESAKELGSLCNSGRSEFKELVV
ncbi:MAG: transposase DNA-binding-containing protein [Cyanobacteria bacterium P01_E01_bin.6]